MDGSIGLSTVCDNSKVWLGGLKNIDVSMDVVKV